MTCTCGPGDVEDKCPGAGERCGCFSPPAFCEGQNGFADDTGLCKTVF